ncbi:Protein HIRA [Smittium mucronatum]|uniref:Protein HIRA n=1 Tax=Smittium mucronatum TaxID=133383 RepID=A0A1R0H8C0_9FUNG|nr:Protein HIRA [Smittium mucronatum]
MKSWMRISNPPEYIASKLNDFSDFLSTEDRKKDFDELGVSTGEAENQSMKGLPNSSKSHITNNISGLSCGDILQSSDKMKQTRNDESSNDFDNILYETQLSGYMQWSNYLESHSIDTKNGINSGNPNSCNPDTRGKENEMVNQKTAEENLNQKEVLSRVISTFGKDAIDEITIEHIEHQLLSSIALDSKGEFIYWVKLYASWLAKFGSRGRISYLCSSLLGPPNDFGILPDKHNSECAEGNPEETSPKDDNSYTW